MLKLGRIRISVGIQIRFLLDGPIWIRFFRIPFLINDQIRTRFFLAGRIRILFFLMIGPGSVFFLLEGLHYFVCLSMFFFHQDICICLVRKCAGMREFC